MADSQSKLDGHVAIISGALGDIGRAIARRLARDGADVALGDVRDETDARSLLDELRGLGAAARYDRVDVSDSDAVRAWVDAVTQDLGAPTLIVPNAAIVTVADILSLTADDWQRQMRVNLDGAFHLAQAGAQHLVAARKPGRIVFLGSWAAHAPHGHIPAYCAGKAGVRMLAKVMARDLAHHGILVNEVAPGYVDAGLTGRVWDEEPEKRERGRQQVPTGDVIAPDEVAQQVAHLCDPANRHMTGACILMDGGLSLTNVSYAQRDE